jgi:hypothetical protein
MVLTKGREGGDERAVAMDDRTTQTDPSRSRSCSRSNTSCRVMEICVAAH